MFKVIYKTQQSQLVMSKLFHTQIKAQDHAEKLIKINKTNKNVHIEVVSCERQKETRLSYFFQLG